MLNHNFVLSGCLQGAIQRLFAHQNEHDSSFLRQTVLQKCNKNSSFNARKIELESFNYNFQGVKMVGGCFIKIHFSQIIIQIFDKILPIPSGI